MFVQEKLGILNKIFEKNWNRPKRFCWVS